MNFKNISVSFLLASLVLLGLGCKKEQVTYFPPEQAGFMGVAGGSYTISGPTVKFTINVGITTVSTVDRTIPILVSSPTGAVQGTHYTLSATSVRIPAGAAVASFEVSGVFAQYTTGRKDSLIFTIQAAGSTKASDGNSVYRLFVQGPCFDGDVTAARRTALVGNYTKCFDGPSPYGPYTASVKSITSLTATTARAVIGNVWDAGFGDVNFILDWTNPLNPTVTLDGPQVTASDAGNLGAAYAGQRIIIRTHATGGAGKFSVCNGTLNLVYQLGVFNQTTNTLVGYFPDVITTAMAR